MKKAKILEVKNITHDVKHFVLEKPSGYQYKTSQATLVAVDKDDWRDEKRPFTFISLSEEPHLEFIIKEYPLSKYPNHGGVTEQIHKLQVGDLLLIDEAWGGMRYLGPGVFIAGGVGMTPFVSICKELINKKETKGNMLLLSNKTKKDVVLTDELKIVFDNQIITNFTREKGSRRIDEDYLKKKIKDFSVYFYICGPKKMDIEIEEILRGLGVDTDRIVRFES